MPRRRAPPRRRSLRLGKPEAEFFEFFDPPRSRNLCLGKPLCLGVALLRLGHSATPRPSYNSSFVLSSVNSRIRYSFVWTINGR